MLERFGTSLRIGISPAGLCLLRVRRWRGAPLTLLAEAACVPGDGLPHQAIAPALTALLAGQNLAGHSVSFVLADELTRLWQVTPPPGAARLADLEGAAALRFQSLYGEAASGWKTMADWQAGAPFFAAAVPLPLLAVLEQAAAEHKFAIVEIVPHFIAAWNRWRRALADGAWFGVLHDGLLTVGIVAAARLHAVRLLPVPHGADGYWLKQVVQREALLAGVEAPALLQVAGTPPAAMTAADAGKGGVRCVALTPSGGAGAIGDGALPSAAQLARAGSFA